MASDQTQPGSFSPERKEPGDEVGQVVPCFGPGKCRLKTWGAYHCRLAAPRGCSRVPRPSKLQTGEDPCHQRNEEICTFGRFCVQGKEQEKRKELEETKRKKEEEERLKKEKKLLKSRDSLAKNEADILKDEKKAREDLESTDELLSDATAKLHDALSASTVNRQSVSVATMMLDTARNKQEQAMQQLKAIGEKRTSLDTKTYKLLQKAIPSAQPPAKKSKKSS